MAVSEHGTATDSDSRGRFARLLVSSKSLAARNVLNNRVTMKDSFTVYSEITTIANSSNEIDT